MKMLERAELTETERLAVEEAARRVKSELPVARVILFGSKARGSSGADSDIDLLILTSEPVTTELRRAISDRLFEVSLDRNVALASVVTSETDWSEGLTRHTLLHSEVERDGCEI